MDIRIRKSSYGGGCGGHKKYGYSEEGGVETRSRMSGYGGECGEHKK